MKGSVKATILILGTARDGRGHWNYTGTTKGQLTIGGDYIYCNLQLFPAQLMLFQDFGLVCDSGV